MSRERIIPLHQNENYWLLDERLAASYASNDPLTYATYPRYDRLREAIAQYAEVGAENILLTPGSDAAILLLAQDLQRAGKRALLPVPTFYGYERIFDIAQLEYETVMYEESDGAFVFPIEESLKSLDRADAIFLCSPNNPLGCEIPIPQLETILNACRERGKLAVVDEAYFEYAGHSMIARLGTQPLCILRTLSKSFALAGARVGYAIGDSALIDTMARAQLPWPIPNPSVHAALIALENRHQLLSRIELVRDALERFSQSLSAIPRVHVYPSCTNFVLVRMPGASRIREALSQKGILVASGEIMSSVPEARQLLIDTLRFATPSPEDRAYVVETIAGLYA